MTTHEKHQAPWYLWPFVAIWKLLAVIVEMTGRLVAMIIGIVLMLVGVLVSLTVIGAIVGDAPDRISTGLAHPWVIGYQRHPTSREFWKYIDIENK